MKILIILLVLAPAIFFVGKNLAIPEMTGVVNGKLRPCPASPNCVSSDAEDAVHAIEPLPNVSDDVLGQITKILQTHYQAKVVKRTPEYLHVVVTSPFFHFKDDIFQLKYEEVLAGLEDPQLELRSLISINSRDYGQFRRIET